MTEQDHEPLAEQFKALGDPVRLRILELLPTNSCACEVHNVGQLAEIIGLAQPTVSHHLKVLRQAGLIRARKLKRDVYYWVDAEAVAHATRRLDNILSTPDDPNTEPT